MTVPVQTGEKVQVVGEVQNPKDIEFSVGETVETAIALAGGPLFSGDLSHLNRSAEVHAGDQVIVPVRADLLATSGLAVTGGVTHSGIVCLHLRHFY